MFAASTAPNGDDTAATTTQAQRHGVYDALLVATRAYLQRHDEFLTSLYQSASLGHSKCAEQDPALSRLTTSLGAMSTCLANVGNLIPSSCFGICAEDMTAAMNNQVGIGVSHIHDERVANWRSEVTSSTGISIGHPPGTVISTMNIDPAINDLDRQGPSSCFEGAENGRTGKGGSLTSMKTELKNRLRGRNVSDKSYLGENQA